MHTHDIPAPTIWPAALAAGVTLLGLGLIVHIVVLVAGLMLMAVALVGWVRDLLGDAEPAALPLEGGPTPAPAARAREEAQHG